MNYGRPNASSATVTRNRVPDPAPYSGIYSVCLKLGLKQLMAGARKFAVKYIDRSDIVALTKEASQVTGIPYVMEADMEEAEKILLK